MAEYPTERPPKLSPGQVTRAAQEARFGQDKFGPLEETYENEKREFQRRQSFLQIEGRQVARKRNKKVLEDLNHKERSKLRNWKKFNEAKKAHSAAEDSLRQLEWDRYRWTWANHPETFPEGEVDPEADYDDDDDDELLRIPAAKRPRGRPRKARQPCANPNSPVECVTQALRNDAITAEAALYKKLCQRFGDRCMTTLPLKWPTTIIGGMMTRAVTLKSKLENLQLRKIGCPKHLKDWDIQLIQKLIESEPGTVEKYLRSAKPVEKSHLCGNDWCGNVNHVVFETSRENNDRKACHQRGIYLRDNAVDKGDGVFEMTDAVRDCTKHNPPCKLSRAILKPESVVLEEWVRLTRTGSVQALVEKHPELYAFPPNHPRCERC